MTILQILSGIGLILSVYSLYVTLKLKKNNAANNTRSKTKSTKIKQYKPICDISDHISCSKAFQSTYGNLAILPNPFFGCIAYALLFFFGNIHWISISLSVMMLCMSLYLAYISYFKMKNFCIICTAIYALNILIFIMGVL